MKIAFIGKGGSGKTTMASLFARYLAGLGLPVLAIDADINQHLGAALGMGGGEAGSLPPMGIEIDLIKDYFRGANPRIRSAAAMVKTTPPGRGSRRARLSEKNPLFDHFERTVDGVRVMAVGEFTEEDLGIKCYHSKVGAAEILLNHLVDDANEYVIVDMTAGADSFASGIFTKFDVMFLVAEPTQKSISVYEQYKKYAKDYGVNIKVVANKVEDESDANFIKEHVGDDLVATFTRSSFVRAAEKGAHQKLSALEPQNSAALDAMHATVDRSEKDWKRFYDHALYFHIKNAESWANEAIGEDARLQIDPEFSIEAFVSSAR
ncbi:MAG TPA: ATP-binding protein [Candidatus Paceibacterota bacterium]|nr:ATP-binding protein [Candidatus Paceibacterota bacterium]